MATALAATLTLTFCTLYSIESGTGRLYAPAYKQTTSGLKVYQGPAHQEDQDALLTEGEEGGRGTILGREKRKERERREEEEQILGKGPSPPFLQPRDKSNFVRP